MIEQDFNFGNKMFKAKKDFYFGNKIIETEKNIYLETRFLNLKVRFLIIHPLFLLKTQWHSSATEVFINISMVTFIQQKLISKNGSR